MQSIRLRKRSVGIRRKLLLEGLSPRALLAGVTTEVLDGIATVSGSSADDEIVIAPMAQRDEVHVFADGQCISAWRRSDVREIDVQAFEGDDLIRVADSVTVPVKVTGGVGLDTILIDHPHDHRHGWLFDVEQVMAEGEFTSSSAVGQTDHANHAGHTSSSASPAVPLSPIPTDHLHVEPQPAATQVETPAVHEHDATALIPVTPVHDTAADVSTMSEYGATHDAPDISSPTTALDQETVLSDSALSTSPHASHVGHEVVAESADDWTVISATLVVISPGSNTGPGEHAGHDAFAVSTDALAPSEHAGHDASTSSTGGVDHSGHASHSAGSAGGADHSEHAGHEASVGSAAGGDHSAHSSHGATAGSTGGLGHSGHALGVSATGHEHGGDTTSTVHSGHAGDVEELLAIEPGSATTRNAGQHDHAAGDNSARHGATGHDHAGRWGMNPMAGAMTGSEVHSGDRCEGPHGKPVSGSGGDEAEHHQASVSTSVPACHSAAGNRKTDATVPQPDAGTRDVKEGEAKPEDRSATKSSPLAMLLAAAGTLLFVCAVRVWRSSTLPNDSDKQTSRFAFEWLGGRGAPNA